MSFATEPLKTEFYYCPFVPVGHSPQKTRTSMAISRPLAPRHALVLSAAAAAALLGLVAVASSLHGASKTALLGGIQFGGCELVRELYFSFDLSAVTTLRAVERATFRLPQRFVE